jgi:glycosyltransferase involved in cell wall biosynthesis
LPVALAFLSPHVGPLVAPHLYPPDVSTGGSETQTWLIARGLARRGRDVAIVLRDGRRGMPPEVESVRIVGLADPNPRNGGPLGHGLVTVSALRRLAPSVVVQRAGGAETALAAVSVLGRSSRFLFSSSSDADFHASRPSWSRIRQGLFRWGLRRSDGIVVQTEAQAALCRRRTGRLGQVVPSVAEPAPARTGEPREFLWLGRLVRNKNPLAFVELARSLPQARFRMVAAPHPLDSELEREVRGSAADVSNLEITGPQRRAEVLKLYDDAVAIVSTSDFEGMPNVFLESWARGVPALALAHDPDSAITSHGLGGWAGSDPLAFRELAAQLWEGRLDQADLSRRCRAYVRREHSEQRALDAWEAILDAG